LGFLWNESLTPIATKVKSAHANELHTNIDTDLGLVGLGGYAWTRSPVIPVTHKMLSKDVVEMMDALDDAYDANKCTAHNSSHFDIDNAGDNTSHQAVHDVTVLAGHDSGVLAGHDSGYNAGHNDAYQATHYVTHQGSNQSSNNGSYNGAHEDSFNSPDRSSYYSGWNDINNYPD
jgi:hypothetical protein